jgi:spore coat polysaccharide biosynthesis predicted glycosyltransferase SpsG/CMP-N-acetylneuraminic acid synthetase
VRPCVVIPAPLHGSPLPRKVLRPLAGRPLLAYTLSLAKAVVASAADVVVITDDDEVALVAERAGAGVAVDPSARGDAIERLLAETVDALERRGGGGEYDAVALLRPAAPMIVPADVQQALALLAEGGYDSVISARADSHHAWMRVGGRYVPDFGSPRALAPAPLFRETGAFIISRRGVVSPERFVGDAVGLTVLPESRSIDITSEHEWWICERLVQRRRIVFVVAGYPAIGMGHAYRAQQIAHEITNHEVTFVCTRESDLAEQVIAQNGYTVVRQGAEPLEETVLALSPHLVVNDFLDTGAGYVRALRTAGARVTNFEDLGPGAADADLVINELFLHPDPPANHRVGHEFFCVRDEFLQAVPKPFADRVTDVLVTFGGADSEDLTSRTLTAIWEEAKRRGIRLHVVTGPGYAHSPRLTALVDRLGSPLLSRANGTKRMSDFMARADAAFSSSGRTLFELATLRVPTIVMACNEREETHPFARTHGGFVYLGRHDRVSDDCLRRAFVELVESSDRRRLMRQALERFDFRGGKPRVLGELSALLGAPLN